MARKRYSNIDEVNTNKPFKDLRKWQKERKAKIKDLSYTMPQYAEKSPAYLLQNRTDTTITWIGHSTFFIQIGGLNIITDPVWAKRMGFSKRISEPGLTMEECPPIDVILLSHAHYDHLHMASLRALPGHPKLLVPDGLAAMMKRKGFKDVAELSWWGSTQVEGVAFHFVPAQHWTRRTLWDTNTSHWGGWVVQDTKRVETIYFAGDSGYFSGFKAIGEKFKIDIALMPIGAYEPEWFMKVSHMTPEEAIQAYLEIGAKQFIPMHYGAFMLADDTPKEAIDRLLNEWRRLQIERVQLRVLELGETANY
ncbi:metal-dependent hydrolase [compost metagenome]